MLQATFILLQCVTLASARSMLNFYRASEHTEVNGNPSAVIHLSPTSTNEVEEDVALNVPHPIASDSITNFDRRTQSNVVSSTLDRTEHDVANRKLPILRAEIDAVKLFDSPPAKQDVDKGDVLSYDKQREAEISNLNRDEESAHRSEATLKSSSAEVELTPTKAVPTLMLSTTAGVVTTARSEAANDIEGVVGKKTENELTGEIIIESEVDIVEHDVIELPSPKTLLLRDKVPKVISSISLNELTNGSAQVTLIDEPRLPDASSVHNTFDPKSFEDEDSDVFNDLDEKSMTLEFHDDTAIATTTAVEIKPSTSPKTELSSSKTEELTEDQEIIDILMYLVTLLPYVQKTETSLWSKIIAGLQCALRDCRKAFPHLTTVATPIGNGTFIIRRARSGCICPIP
ncbi:hypothetical protein V3C99_012085 [Haemonchus contortus]